MLKEIRKINTSELQRLCIKYNLYNAGCNEEYMHMFDMCKGNLTMNKLEKIATDIYEHTHFSDDWTGNYGDPEDDKAEYIEALAWYILHDAVQTTMEMR